MYDWDLAEYHDAHAGLLAREAGATLLRHLRAAGLTSGHVVDVGCGGGILAEVVARAGYSVTGYDPSPAMLQMAAERVPRETFLKATAADLRLPSGLVAIAAVSEVLSYDLIVDLDEFLEACHAALRPGGVLMLDVPGPQRHGPQEEVWEVHERKGAFLAVHAITDRMRLTREITLFTHTKGGRYRRHTETHVLRLYPPQDVRTGLARAGFVAIRAVPAYGQAPVAFGDHWSAFVATRP